MVKSSKIIISTVLVLSLLFGSTLAGAAPKGNGKGSGKEKGKEASQLVVKEKEATEKEVKEKAPKEKAKQPQGKAFKDVDKHWAKAAIERLQLLGIVSGFPDGSFKPDDSITQAQAIAMVVSTMETEATEEQEEAVKQPVTEEELSEVPGWAKKVVGKAASKGIINLNRFHSAEQASRLQTMVYVAKALGLEPADTSNIPFKDGILVSAEDLGYVMALYNQGIIKGTPGGMLNPNSSITRAEIAAIIDRILKQKEEQQEPTEEITPAPDTQEDEDAADDDSEENTEDEGEEESSNQDTTTEETNE